MATQKKTNTIKIGGKDIPLTKKGTPNKVHLNKDQKQVVDTYVAKKKKEKKEIAMKELEEILKKLG